MKHPGSNLLKRAAKLIRQEPVQYSRFLGRQKNVAFQFVDEYAEAFTLMASVQPVSREKYAELGLDFAKNYVKAFASDPLNALHRDSAGDQFTYDGMLFKIESNGTWFHRDGWASCVAVEIGKAPP